MRVEGRRHHRVGVLCGVGPAHDERHLAAAAAQLVGELLERGARPPARVTLTPLATSARATALPSEPAAPVIRARPEMSNRRAAEQLLGRGGHAAGG